MPAVSEWEGDVSGKGASPGVVWASWSRQRVIAEVTDTLVFLGPGCPIPGRHSTLLRLSLLCCGQTPRLGLPGPASLPGHLPWIRPQVAVTRTPQSLTSVPKPPGHPEDTCKTSAEAHVHAVTYTARTLPRQHPQSGPG